MKKKIEKILRNYLCRGEANNTFVEHWIEAYDSTDAKNKYTDEYGAYFKDDSGYAFRIKEVK